MKCFIGRNKVFICILIVFIVLSSVTTAQSANAGDWFSKNTLASVVKLQSLLAIYEVEGLPENYTFRTKGEKPDFGDARIVNSYQELVHVGTGVVVTEDGLIISNAHVTRAYEKPEIEIVYGLGDRPKLGSDGKPIKRIIYNLLPECMFVGVVNGEKLAEEDNDSQKLTYIAYVVTDDANYDNQYRDRAILSIFTYAYEDSDGLPVIDSDKNNKEFSVSFAEFGNPFKTSYIDKKVRAIGFPGSGDPNRSSRTSGELLGYQDSESSVLLHTSWISGGNSGGGLFYNDKLIGINTWDNREIASRPVAQAQPITYWYDMFAKVEWLYPKMNLPDFDIDWLQDDPSTDSYKDMAQVAFRVVSESNKNNPVTNGYLYAHRLDSEISDIIEYQDVSRILSKLWYTAKLLWYCSVDEVVKFTGFSYDTVSAMTGVYSLEDFRNKFNDDVLPIFDEWTSPSFYYTYDSLDSDTGKVVLSVPKNTKLNISYIDDNGKSDTFVLTVDDNYMQGAYSIPVSR